MNEDIKALLEKAQESLSAGKMLRDQGYHGFAASRAYYAMFYVAEALLSSLGQSYTSHGGVIGAFGREFAKAGTMPAKFHRWLIDGQDVRNISDYGIGIEISQEQTDDVLAHSKEFIEAAQGYLEDQERR